jgi:hypothetical protein
MPQSHAFFLINATPDVVFALCFHRNTFLVLERAPSPYLSRGFKLVSGATRLDVPGAFWDPIGTGPERVQKSQFKRCRGGGWPPLERSQRSKW